MGWKVDSNNDGIAAIQEVEAYIKANQVKAYWERLYNNHSMIITTNKIYFIILIVGFFLISIIFMMSCSRANISNPKKENKIYWPENKKYKAIVKSLKLSPEEAKNRLFDHTRNMGAKSYFYNSLIFVVNDYYFFTDPEKDSIQLEGFYVNGMTGEIEYRTSSVIIKKRIKYLPTNAFIEISKIKILQ